MVTVLRGNPSLRATATAATASGGATIAPSANAAAGGNSGRSRWVIHPMTSVVNSTRPIESSPICRRKSLSLR